MNDYKNTILSMLRKGMTTKEIAEAFSSALNEAEADRKVEEEKKKKEEEKKNSKREAMRNVLGAINDYYIISQGRSPIDKSDLTDAAIDIICNAMDDVKISISDSWFNPFKFFGI